MALAASSSPADFAPARPLSPSAALGLIASAMGMIALCYLFSLVAMLGLAVAIVFELALGLALLRFGLLGVIAPVIRCHAGLLALFFRSLWLGSTPEYRLRLARAEAPRLFEMIERLAARLAIPAPREVLLEMSVGAWVELRGWRRGSKNTRLGLGYDLLAGLTEAEVEAVLAHEMAHARLVRRGVKWWVGGGIARMAQLTQLLRARVDELRRAKADSAVARACLRVADACTRVAARLAAAHSRQDEFEADRGAAELCGPAPLVSSLKKLRRLAAKTARLGWHERVAHLQRGAGYGAWLLGELERSPGDARAGAEADEVTDPYSTHPSLTDRIAALPATPAEGAAAAGSSSLALLAEPDAVAARLVAEIDRVLAIEEAKDLKRLRGVAGKLRGGAALRGWRAVGVLFAVCGLVLAIVIMGANEIGAAAVAFGGGLALAAGCYRLGRPKDDFTFPMPSRTVIRLGLEKLEAITDLAAADKALLEERRRAAKSGEFGEASFHCGEAFEALERGDYLHAHVSARLTLELDNQCIPAALALAVAAGATRQPDLIGDMLRFVRTRTGLHTPGTLWGIAWALYLLRDHPTAEALLEALRKKQPEEPTILQLLADCAAARGKRHAALAHARAACAAAPAERSPRIQLIGLLVDLGHHREADMQLAFLRPLTPEERELRLHRLRLSLLGERAEEAQAIAGGLLNDFPGDGPLCIDLGAAHEEVRADDAARRFYEQALEAGHYPVARLALGRLAARAGDAPAARAHLLAALDTKRPLGARSAPPLSVFFPVVAELAELEGKPVACRAWVATFTCSATAGPLADTRFVLFAPTADDAAKEMRVLTDAVLPGHDLQPSHVGIALAPPERQPAGLVVPGVKYIWE